MSVQAGRRPAGGREAVPKEVTMRLFATTLALAALLALASTASADSIARLVAPARACRGTGNAAAPAGDVWTQDFAALC
jgi:hypothetical protein